MKKNEKDGDGQIISRGDCGGRKQTSRKGKKIKTTRRSRGRKSRKKRGKLERREK